jgi:hypothetical protein
VRVDTTLKRGRGLKLSPSEVKILRAARQLNKAILIYFDGDQARATAFVTGAIADFEKAEGEDQAAAELERSAEEAERPIIAAAGVVDAKCDGVGARP